MKKNYGEKKEKGWRKIIVIILILFLVLIIAKSFFVIRGSISGEVVDKVTQKPISGIEIERKFMLEMTKGPSGTDVYKVETLITYTDKEGRFNLGPKFIIKIPLLTWFGKEWVNVNILPYNKNYHKMGEYLTLEYPSYPKILPVGENKKYYYIELIPKVKSLEGCDGVDICIKQNAYELATMFNNISYCSLIDIGEEDWKGHREQNSCYIYFAKLNNNPNSCYMVDNSRAPGGGWSDRDLCFLELNHCELAELPEFREKVCGVIKVDET